MKLPPLLVVATGVVFTATSAILVRLSVSPPLIIAAYRMWFTTLILAPFVVTRIIRNRNNPVDAGRAEAGGRPGGRIIGLSILSGVLLAIHFGSWIASLSYASVAGSVVIVSTHPVIVAIGGALILKERLGARAFLFIVAAMAGGVVLVIGGFGQGGSEPFGYLLAFVGAVTMSGYMLIGRVVRQHLSADRYTFVVYGVAAICLTAGAAVAGNPLVGYPPREILIFLALAVFCTLLGHSLFNWALRYLRPAIISTSILGEPVISSVLAVIIFREAPTAPIFAGGAIILLSIFLFVRESARSA